VQAKKLTKSICVSNFNPKQLDTVIGMGGTVHVASKCSKGSVVRGCSKEV
jgi:diketogulonate reductase-like aldo/keto reductase